MPPEPKTVLFADDEKPLRLLVRATLAGSGYELLETTDGEEALAIARRDRPDVALLDVGMPGLDGYAVCRTLKSDPATAQIKVVLLTARSQASDRARGEEAGADKYLVKPFSPKVLLETVNELLER